MVDIKMIDEKKAFREDYKYFLTRIRKASTIVKEIEEFTEIKLSDKIKVLAVGGEYGFIEYNLTKWTNWDIITSDIEPILVNKYPILKSFLQMMVVDSTKLPFHDKTFDLVIFNHVIEHIPNYRKAVEELHRVLKEKGCLYLATPNLHRKLAHPKMIFTGKKNLSDSSRIARHMGFSEKELMNLLSDFSNIQNITKIHQLSNLKLARKIAKALPKKIFHRYSQTNVFICRK